jgi:hypothetical protein
MIALGIQGLAACGKNENKAGEATAAQAPSACDDLSAVSESDLATREKLGYVKTSPIADNQCQNCNLFLPPKEGEKCGGCMLFKGPVFAEAYCTYWAPKL